MTFRVTVKDDEGNPIEGCLVTATDLNTGGSFPRSTDGAGYADCAMLGSSQLGDHVTLSVEDPQLRFKGVVFGDTLAVTDHDQAIEVTLVPFV